MQFTDPRLISSMIKDALSRRIDNVAKFCGPVLISRTAATATPGRIPGQLRNRGLGWWVVE
jgi:hypothetical protein